jgi:hypothetical protein
MNSLLKFFLLLIAVSGSASLTAQNPIWADDLLNRYDRYREASIKDRRFKHGDILPLLQSLPAKGDFEIRERGRSVEGRPIYLVRYGNGPAKVLLWSQMHGDEPTATMALFDLFNFLAADDQFNDLRNLISTELSLYFLPMLNPDGAEVYERRNALDIDINRDAARLQTPEGRLLKEVRDEIDADWGFNLHDQSPYNAVGQSAGEATFSFLAPAYDQAKSINEVRGDAMRLIVFFDQWLQQYLPGQVARFDDTFEPRAFGDNMQAWGTRTILIECGGLEGDPEKQKIRKLHFGLFLLAFESIARQTYSGYSVHSYEQIAFNNRKLFDLLIREVRLEERGRSYVVDLGFHRNESDFGDYRRFYYNGSLADLGDLSTSNGYQELYAPGYTIEQGKTYPAVLPGLSSLKQMDYAGLHRQGYTDIRLQSLPKRSETDRLPFRVHGANARIPANEVRLGKNPSFFLVRNGKREYVVVNGFLYEVK